MNTFKKIVTLVLAFALTLSFASCAKSPYIGENGNWFVGDKDTGVNAGGIKGDKGDDGESVKISKFDKLESDGSTDTYQITFSTGLTTQIKIENGVTPEVVGFEPVGTSNDGKTTYEIRFSNGAVAAIRFSNGKDGTDGVNTVENLDIIYSNTIGNNALVAEAETLDSGSYLLLENNTVMNNKHLSVAFSLDELGDGEIYIGHGENEYSASYIVLDKTSLRIVTEYGANDTEKVVTHKLSAIKGYVRVAIDVSNDKAKIQIMTPDNDLYSTSNISWQGRQGSIFVKPVGFNLTDVKLNWSSDDYQNDIYMIGDSYFNLTAGERWTSYLVKNNYTNNLMLSFPGMTSKRGLSEFKQALEHGTPKYAFWCMGMNDGDKNGEINENWLSSVEEFIEICESKGIIPILSTIPSTPTVDNSYKNAWVKSQNYRYVDFAKAVGADVYNENNIGKTYMSGGSEVTNVTGYEWYKGMLYTDLVHPATLGAEALYMQAIADFPELMQK